eukprot:1828456-Prymnesium_polylepis.1
MSAVAASISGCTGCEAAGRVRPCARAFCSAFSRCCSALRDTSASPSGVVARVPSAAPRPGRKFGKVCTT